MKREEGENPTGKGEGHGTGLIRGSFVPGFPCVGHRDKELIDRLTNCKAGVSTSRVLTHLADLTGQARRAPLI